MKKKEEKQKEKQKYSALAIVAFVLSFIPILSVIGVILGVIALLTMPKNRKGKGFAIAAIIIGLIVTLAIVLLIVAGIQFFNAVFSGMKVAVEKDLQENIAYCKTQKPGILKDMCIITALSVHANETNTLDRAVCNEITTEGLPDFCLALVTGDKGYCKNMVGESRIKCYGMLEEFEQAKK